jgi:hypothetical protein
MKSRAGIVHPQRDDFYAVAVVLEVLGNRRVRSERRGEYQPDFTLRQHIRSAVAHARFQPRIGQRLEPESGFVKMCGLFGVADVEFDVVRAEQGQEVFGLGEYFLETVVVVLDVGQGHHSRAYVNYCFEPQWV